MKMMGAGLGIAAGLLLVILTENWLPASVKAQMPAICLGMWAASKQMETWWYAYGHRAPCRCGLAIPRRYRYCGVCGRKQEA